MRTWTVLSLRLFMMIFCVLAFLSWPRSPTAAQENNAAQQRSAVENPTGHELVEKATVHKTSAAQLKAVVQAAFLETHQGWSSDEVLVQDELNRLFLAACRRRHAMGTETEFNWTMLNLRKASQLPAKVTRRQPLKHDAYRHAAEIAARGIEDRHRQNIDRALCDPQLRGEFDSAAITLAPEISAYRLRKAALGLRKSRRLQPELVVRVADWQRTVLTFKLKALVADLAQIPEQPGIYLFSDASGYLYIGEAANLRTRMTDHLRQSDRPSLARYLNRYQAERSPQDKTIRVEVHAFAKASPAKQVAMRRAYESELIRSRKPRLNIRP